MKKYLLLLSLLISISIQSQIKIGQPVNETLAILDNLSKLKQMKVSADYRNGRVVEIITYKHHQLFYDLDVITDEIGRYIIDENDNYAYNIMQYPQLPLSFVAEKLDKYYGNDKIEDYYFTNDFEDFMKLSLINEYASVIHGKSTYSGLPESISNKIQIKRKLKKQQKIIKEEKAKNEQRLFEIESLQNDFFNIDNYEKGYSLKVISLLEDYAIKKSFENRTYLNQKSFEELKSIYGIRIYTEAGKRDGKLSISKLSTNIDYEPEYLKDFKIDLPIIKENFEGIEYELNREINIFIEYNLKIGEVILTKKADKIKSITDNNLTDIDKSKIIFYLKDYKNGKYSIQYQIGSINDKEATNIKAIKI